MPKRTPPRFRRGADLRVEVKGRLRTVVLAYLLERPRTGRQLMEVLRRDFGVTVSPGRMYPLLWALERQGLVRARREEREIYYRPRDRGRARAHLRASLEAGTRLFRFLRGCVNNA